MATMSGDADVTLEHGWLHLADLEFGRPVQGGWDQARVLDAVLRDVMERVGSRQLPAPRQVFITGNLTHAATADQFERAGEWLARLGEAIGVVPAQVFTVPGPSDVQADDPTTARLVEGVRDGINDLDDVMASKSGRAQLAARQGNYRAFDQRRRGAATGEGELWWSRRAWEGDLRLRVCGFNSVLVSTRDDRGKLRVGYKQLKQLLTIGPESTELVIALSHHPAFGNWLDEEDEFVARLGAAAHLHLHNRTVDGGAEMPGATASRGCLHIGVGLVHATDQAPASAPEGFVYNFCSVVRGSEGQALLRVWSRSWSRGQYFRNGRLHGGAYTDYPLTVLLASSPVGSREAPLRRRESHVAEVGLKTTANERAESPAMRHEHDAPVGAARPNSATSEGAESLATRHEHDAPVGAARPKSATSEGAESPATRYGHDAPLGAARPKSATSERVGSPATRHGHDASVGAVRPKSTSNEGAESRATRRGQAAPAVVVRPKMAANERAELPATRRGHDAPDVVAWSKTVNERGEPPAARGGTDIHEVQAGRDIGIQQGDNQELQAGRDITYNYNHQTVHVQDRSSPQKIALNALATVVIFALPILAVTLVAMFMEPSPELLIYTFAALLIAGGIVAFIRTEKTVFPTISLLAGVMTMGHRYLMAVFAAGTVTAVYSEPKVQASIDEILTGKPPATPVEPGPKEQLPTCAPGEGHVNGVCTRRACGGGMQRADDGSCVCPAGQEPWNRRCVLVCDGGKQRADDGKCTCPAGQEPWDGVCVPECVGGTLRTMEGGCACPDGQDLWNGGCIPKCEGGTQRTVEGACVCPEGQVLIVGVCQVPCAVERQRPDGTCGCPEGQVDDGEKCRVVCEGGKVRSGKCVCPAKTESWTMGCRAPCTGGQERAASGECVCPTGTEPWRSDCLESCRGGTHRHVDGTCRCPGVQELTSIGCSDPCEGGKQRTADGKCACPSGWEESAAGTCACPNGLQPLGRTCVIVCPEDEEVSSQDACFCPADREWVGRICKFKCDPGTGRDSDGECVAMTCPSSMAFIAGGMFDGHPVVNFCMDITEVTVAACDGKCGAQVYDANDNQLKLCTVGREGWDMHPVNCISRDDAKRFCESRGKHRLPSAREWRWAARGGRADKKPYPWGPEPPNCNLAVFKGCTQSSTAPVGTRLKKSYSVDKLKDMAGNVAEWTRDGDGVALGGSWFSTKNQLTIDQTQDYLGAPRDVGFRCIKVFE
jgi:hypothetical protein